MSTFNIGSQNAASIQNVGGDMVVHDGVHVRANVRVIEFRDRLGELRQEIDRLDLPAEHRAAAAAALDEAAAEAAAPAPRAKRIADCMRRVGETIDGAGVLASAAACALHAVTSALALVPLFA
jgi:hypothetical protein